MIKINKKPKQIGSYVGWQMEYSGREPIINHDQITRRGEKYDVVLCSRLLMQRNTRHVFKDTTDTFEYFKTERELFKWICDGYENEKEEETIGFITLDGEKGLCVRQNFDHGLLYGYLAKYINNLNHGSVYFGLSYNEDRGIMTRNIQQNCAVTPVLFNSSIALYQWLSQ